MPSQNPDDRGNPPSDKNIIDATPGPNPRNITETKAWKSSSLGITRFWNNYKRLLSESFSRMDRAEQESLIRQFSITITMGVAILITLVFYSVIPQGIRVIAVPVALVAAWWAGSRVVAQVVITRLESTLNR